MILHLTVHLLVSLLVGFIFWFALDRKSKKTLFWCLFFGLLSGVLIDTDHLFDYVRAYGFTWSPHDFFQETYFLHSGKNYVLFHGFEFVLIIWVTSFFLSMPKRLFGMVLGTSLLFHLVIDIALAGVAPISYFFIFRALTNFRAM